MGVFCCPMTDGAFSLHCLLLTAGVCPVSFRRFASWLSFFVPPRSTGFLLMLLLGALALLLCALARLVFLLRFFLFRLVRSPPIACLSPGEKQLLYPLPRVRASCARASRVSNNCLHLFTQCAQLLDMECFVVKANCQVLRFTFLPDGCKALSFSEIR